MTILSKLQQYNWTKANIINIMTFLKTNQIPNNFTSRQKKAFTDKFEKNFAVKQGSLIYTPINLTVVPSDDEKLKNKILTQIYKSPEALGKGQNNFHQLVLQKYLGIKRKDVIDFLKKQPAYQMFQNKPKVISRGVQAKYPFQYWAIDLVDVENLYSQNRPYKYILTATDLFTRYVWYFPMKNKTAPETLRAFNDILKYNLKFHDATTRKKMTRENRYDYPSFLLLDNGDEFKGVFAETMKANGVKLKLTPSYSPQVNVEAMNGILRNLMRALFIKNQNLIWKPYIIDFMKSKNSNRDENTKQTGENLLKEYFKNKNYEKVEKAKENIKKKGNKAESRIKRFQNQEFQKDDLVRVKLSNFQSAIRAKNKAGNQKQVIVKFSPSIYKIEKVISVKSNATGFPLYILKDNQDRIILNEDGKKRVFKGADLLKIPKDTLPSTIDLTKVNFLNRVEKEDQGIRARDLFIEPEEAEVEIPKPPKENKPKSPKNYTFKEWDELLEGKTFVDEGIQWKIYEVYKDKNRFVVDYYDSKFANRSEDFIKQLEKETSYLKEVLEFSQNEDWFQPEFNNYLKK